MNPATGQPATVIAVTNYAGSFRRRTTRAVRSAAVACPGERCPEDEPAPGRHPGSDWNFGYWGTIYEWIQDFNPSERHVAQGLL